MNLATPPVNLKAVPRQVNCFCAQVLMADCDDVPFQKFDRFFYKTLPQFSGRHLDWTVWFELFQIAVGLTDLVPKRNLSYLKDRLDKETRETIEGYIADDYDEVIALLKEKFT